MSDITQGPDLGSTLHALSTQIAGVNRENGWFTGPERTFGDDCMLLATEVGEMFDAWREHGFDDMTRPGSYRDDAPPKPEGVGSEAADVFIRLLDLCWRRKINLAAETERKLAYNRTRGFRHGGKRL